MTDRSFLLECGCEFQFELIPCEEHLKSLSENDEHLNIQLEFLGKYSRWDRSKHNVNLERVQRLHLRIDEEPMEFTETTLADMLQEMADERPLDEHSFTLRAFANALRGTDTHHVLTLKQKRPGKWKSPAELEEQWNREASWLWTLGHWEHDGMKTEAAIAKIAELAGVSRATVFAGVREAEKRLERAAQLMTGDELPLHLRNPRPSKS